MEELLEDDLLLPCWNTFGDNRGDVAWGGDLDLDLDLDVDLSLAAAAAAAAVTAAAAAATISGEALASRDTA